MEDTKVITLDKPIVVGETSYESLTLREPEAGELERATKGDRAGLTVTIDLISMIAGVPRKVAEKLPSRKLSEAAQFIEGFTVTGPQTGEA
jgi:hypothetical protein